LVRDDIAGGRQQPKVQWFDEQLFIVLRVLQSVAGGSETTMSELYVFARPGILVTVGPRQGAGSFDVAAALDAAYPAVLGFGTLGAVHAIVVRVVHGYLTVARDIEEELGGLEDQVFDETQKTTTFGSTDSAGESAASIEWLWRASESSGRTHIQRNVQGSEALPSMFTPRLPTVRRPTNGDRDSLGGGRYSCPMRGRRELAELLGEHIS
jgi:Mg2+ and Co2+ transporter CorA